MRQLSGEYKVRSETIRPLWREVRDLMGRFAGARAVWVPREENGRADALSVEAYVGVLEAERRERASSVRLEALGDGLYLANGRYLVDVRWGTVGRCACPDWKRLNSGRFAVRCKHLIAAEISERGVAPVADGA